MRCVGMCCVQASGFCKAGTLKAQTLEVRIFKSRVFGPPAPENRGFEKSYPQAPGLRGPGFAKIPESCARHIPTHRAAEPPREGSGPRPGELGTDPLGKQRAPETKSGGTSPEIDPGAWKSRRDTAEGGRPRRPPPRGVYPENYFTRFFSFRFFRATGILEKATCSRAKNHRTSRFSHGNSRETAGGFFTRRFKKDQASHENLKFCQIFVRSNALGCDPSALFRSSSFSALFFCRVGLWRARVAGPNGWGKNLREKKLREEKSRWGKISARKNPLGGTSPRGKISAIKNPREERSP